MSYKTDVEQAWRGREVKFKGRRVTGKTMFEVGLVVEGLAKLLPPIDTGRLAASITTQAMSHGTSPEGKGAQPGDKIQAPNTGNEVFVGTPVFYGPYIEFGTMRNAARPFLRPALAIARGDALTIFLKNGKAEFKDFVRR